MTEAQIEIKDWFDQTYKKWGFTYLRPLEAYEIFATLLTPRKESKHLDVACGLGLMLKTMKNNGSDVHGIDLSDEAINGAKKFVPEASVQQGNAEQLPFENESFDTITCIGSLERMLDREKVLKEQVRVAKQDATFCYMVRNSEHFVWKYFWNSLRLRNKKGHQDAMNLKEWSTLFENCGFKIKSVHPDHWPYYKVRRFLTPWKKMNFSKVRKFPLNISLAYEFIFVLEKA